MPPRLPSPPTPSATAVEVIVPTIVVEDIDWETVNRTARAIAEARHGFMSAPDEPLRYDNGSWVENDVCPQGSLHLSSLIGQGGSSSIFGAWLVDDSGTSRRPVVVKHVNNCRELIVRGRRNARARILNEAIMMHVLGPLGLTPALIHLSRPTLLHSMRDLPTRLQSAVLMAHPIECLALKSETVFLVAERAGVELFFYFDYLQNQTDWIGVARRAVPLAIRIVQMLESLHRLGIVHGDIHGGNLLFKSLASSPNQIAPDDVGLVFIDFEFSFFYPSRIGDPVQNLDPGNLSPIWLSPWQLKHHRVARRDDVYRAMEWLADTLSLGAWYRNVTEQIERATKRGSMDEDLAGLKDVNALFTHTAPVAAPSVRAELDHIAQSHLAKYEHPDDRPEYDAIVAHLQAIVHSLST